MKKSPLAGLLMRTAVARGPDVGYIYAADPKKEKDDIPHAITFKFDAGAFVPGECNYDADSICLVTDPEFALVDISGAGYYSVVTRNGNTSGEILDDSQPAPKKRRTAGFRSVSEIGGKAYAVGLRGMVYRLDAIKKWRRIDDGLPPSFDIQAIHGFGDSDIYAVGRDGDLWSFDGKKWTKRELPTNANLTAVKCAGDQKVYIAGHSGVLIRGRGDAWVIIDHKVTDDDFWDIEWFEGRVFVSTMRGVYCAKGETLERVDFGKDAPKSCYQLSAAHGVMWSNGEFDIMSFDGKKWKRVV